MARPSRHMGDHDGARDSGGYLPQLQLLGESSCEQDAKREEEESQCHMDPHKPRPVGERVVTSVSLQLGKLWY